MCVCVCVCVAYLIRYRKPKRLRNEKSEKGQSKQRWAEVEQEPAYIGVKKKDIYQRSVKKISAMEQKATDTSFFVTAHSDGNAAAPNALAYQGTEPHVTTR